MDDDACFLCFTQLCLQIPEFLKPLRVVLTFRAVGNVDVGSDVVRNKAARGRMSNAGEVIEGIILNLQLFLFQKGFLMLDLDHPLKSPLKSCLGVRFLCNCRDFHDDFSL